MADGRSPSTQETWDDFFGDFYLRVHAAESAREEAAAGEQARAAARLARGWRDARKAARCSTPRAASAGTRSRWRGTGSP